MKTVKKMKNTCHSIRFWQLGKNRFIRLAATDARLGIGFRMSGIYPTCRRPEKVGTKVIGKETIPRLATTPALLPKPRVGEKHFLLILKLN